jgi:hypothetical protein
MKLIFHDKGNEGGIYKIINLQNGRIYIGSTYRFKDRARGHKTELEAGRHLNKFLQNDYKKCGSEAFLFEVIETVMGDRKTRVEREQFHIDQWYDNQKNCYNLVPYAMDSRGGSRNKKQIDPLTDGRCKPFSEERLLKHIEKSKEVWQDPTLKEGSRQNAYKQWSEQSNNNLLVTNRNTGEKAVITGSVRQFCLDRGLSYKAFHQLVKGKIKSSNGWFLGEEEPEYVERNGEVRGPMSKENRDKHSSGKYLGIRLVRDSGEELIIGNNVKDQCREFGLPYTTVLKVLNGQCRVVSGYHL